jgi:hypothetical protein
MCNSSKILVAGILAVQLTMAAQGAASYSLDNNMPNAPVNASDGTEPLDNWFGNEFIAQAGANLITAVQFGVFTTSLGTTGSVVLYKVTDPGGDPSLGATRVYTQNFIPPIGDGTNASLLPIVLTNPVFFNTGDHFLVSVFIANVIANPPNDVYPYVIDNGTTSAGSYWDRSAPNTFNLDNLSQAKTIDQPLTAGGFAPGPGHTIIRATGDVPEPSTLALGALGIAAWLAYRRRSK